jgi:translation initiation factor IF-2
MSDNGNVGKDIELPGSLTVRQLAETIEISPIEIIKILMTNGVMANINQQIDFDTAAIVAAELGFDATMETVDQIEAEDESEIPLWRRLITSEDEADLSPRPPVVTILGHVELNITTGRSPSWIHLGTLPLLLCALVVHRVPMSSSWS